MVFCFCNSIFMCQGLVQVTRFIRCCVVHGARRSLARGSRYWAVFPVPWIGRALALSASYAVVSPIKHPDGPVVLFPTEFEISSAIYIYTLYQWRQPCARSLTRHPPESRQLSTISWIGSPCAAPRKAISVDGACADFSGRVRITLSLDNAAPTDAASQSWCAEEHIL